jgi:hypothetical protein
MLTSKPRKARFRYQFLCLLAAWFLAGDSVQARDDLNGRLNLARVTLSRIRSYLTENWAKVDFTVVNTAKEPRLARVAFFFISRPDVQYARDVWVPGQSSNTSWVLLGPPPLQPGSSMARDVEVLLYDRTGGREQLVLPPGEMRVRSHGFLYHPRESITCVLVDRSEPTVSSVPRWNEITEQALRLLYVYRRTSGQVPIHLELYPDPFLPASAEAFDGIDTFVLAGRRLAEDPAGALALRRWLQQGGTLWVMLDLADPAVVARLLGDNVPIQVVDRTSLTKLQVVVPRLQASEQSPPVELERAVDIVRVLLTPEYQVLHTINGWPASFTRSFGRGKVLFTTVGAPAWFRERTEKDGPLALEGFADLPVPLQPLLELSRKFGIVNQPNTPGLQSKGTKATADALPCLEASRRRDIAALDGIVEGEIGYSVPARSLAAMVFASFLSALVGAGLILQLGRRLEIAALCGPVLAIGAALAFVLIGQSSRHAVPPTMSSAEIVSVAPASPEQSVAGLVAQYRPDGGVLPVSSTAGGMLELDTSGLQGQTRRRVISDLRDWYWEDLAVPAGLRMGEYHYTIRTDPPLGAVAQWGPKGLSGQINSGPYHQLADALIRAPTGRPVAVRLGANGAFAARIEDRLAEDQYLTQAVLSDRQQRRVEVYRRLMVGNDPVEANGQELLYVWSEHYAMPFALERGARKVASSLLAIPLEFVRPPSDTAVSIPGGFVPCSRMLNQKMVLPVLESGSPVDMVLRFQVPQSILPLKLERARLTTTVRAPARHFTVAAFEGAGGGLSRPVELFKGDGLTETISVDISRRDLLEMDKQGGFYLKIAVGDLPGEVREPGGNTLRWSLGPPELEIAGRTLPVK